MKKKKMKKKSDWLTKEKKRRAKKKDRGIVDVMMFMRHFFKELPQWLNEMADPRNLSYITYSQSDLVLMGILKNMCAVKSMRSMEEIFNEQQCIDTLRLLSGDRGADGNAACRYPELLSGTPVSGLSGGCKEKDGKKSDPEEKFLPFQTPWKILAYHHRWYGTLLFS